MVALYFEPYSRRWGILILSILSNQYHMSGLIFGFLFVISLLFIAIRKRSLDLSPFQITYLHSLIKKISKHLPLYKLPSKASGLKYLIISYVDKLFLKQKIQFHISNDLVAYSSYSFKTF